MIQPTAADVVRAIEHTLETVIRPALVGSAERSAAASIMHLLRHVELRIEHEGQILYDDIAALHLLLKQFPGYFLARRDLQAAAAIDAAIAADEAPTDRYPQLADVAERAGRLRAALGVALSALQAVRTTEGGRPEYEHLRSSIREYVADQIRREGALIHPAFAGRGPRR